jgi:hypothetical protein
VGPDGAVPLTSLKPLDSTGLRPGTTAGAGHVAVRNPSRLVYDIAGRGFTRLRGTADVENARLEIGATLNPALRFFIFDVEPGPRLIPPEPGTPLPAPGPLTTPGDTVRYLFEAVLGRPPSPEERTIAEAAVHDAERPGRVSTEGVADLLWALLMKPEFQLIY